MDTWIELFLWCRPDLRETVWHSLFQSLRSVGLSPNARSDGKWEEFLLNGEMQSADPQTYLNRFISGANGNVMLWTNETPVFPCYWSFSESKIAISIFLDGAEPDLKFAILSSLAKNLVLDTKHIVAPKVELRLCLDA